MKIKINNKYGLTLTELIVSTVLIGIVMLGVAAFSFGIKSIQDATSNGAILITRTTSAMSQFHKYGSQAIGYQDDPGIRLEGWATLPLSLPAPTTSNWIAFRNDNNLMPTPDDYTDDDWIFLIFDPSDNTLRKCSQPEGSGPGLGSVPDVTASGPCHPDNSLVLSKSIDDVSYTLQIDTSATALEFYVEITLNSVFNPDLAIDPITNPEYNLTTRLSPTAHSW